MNELMWIILCLVILVVGSRLMVTEMNQLSKLLHASAFGLSVLILGFLTSLPELSVAINAQLDQQPQIYAGNLMGGSFLLLSGIIPLFAFLQRGLNLKKTLQGHTLLLFLVLLSLPLLAALNGVITRIEAVVMIVMYGVFLLTMKPVSVEKVRRTTVPISVWTVKIAKIAVISVAIYLACTQLVDITETAAVHFGIPAFIISFLALSIGTNIPELTLALQAIFRKTSDVAFGDYVGSAAMNPLMLSIFSLYHGSYALGLDGLTWIVAVFLGVNVLFGIFAVTQRRLSKYEALTLLVVYGAVTLIQALGTPALV